MNDRRFNNCKNGRRLERRIQKTQEVVAYAKKVAKVRIFKVVVEDKAGGRNVV